MNKSLHSYLQNKHTLCLEPEEIDTSGNWLFWSEKTDESFCAQLASWGQLVPVLVAYEKGKWLLVSGQKRVNACKRTRQSVLALQVDADDWTKGIIYIQANLDKQIDAKKALAALRYFQQIAEGTHWWEQALGYLQIPVKGPWAKSLSNWLKLPRSWDNHLYAEHIELVCAPLLARFDKDELDVLEDFFSSLAWSRNNARNFLTWLWEIGKRENKSLQVWMPRTDLPEVLQSELSPKDKIAKILREIRAKRFPKLSELEKKSYLLCKDLSKGKKWEINVDPSFEQSHVFLKACLKNRKELNLALEQLEELSSSTSWEELWSLAQEQYFED